MYHPPFHRRILPWLYIAIFLGTAPLLIFYTAGYRYNPKKHQVERSGTLIVDSSPKGAHVFLDGQDTQEVSPITFQNIAPGWHDVKLVKSGYHSWQNTLDLRAEQVTFANNIWLWRESSSTLVHTGSIRALRSDPTNNRLALVLANTTSTSLALWAADTGWQSRGEMSGLSPTSSVMIRWRNDGQAFVLNGLTSDDHTWWGTARESLPWSDQLPDGAYHWSQNELIGSNDQRTFRLDPDRNTFVRDVLATTTVSADRDMTIESTSTSPNLLLTYRAFKTHLFSLPFGNWRIGELRQSFALLHDHTHWLSVALTTAQPFITSLYGDGPRWLEGSSVPRALFLNNHEIWEWVLGTEPTLLWRQSDPLVQVAWHRSGSTVFVATQHNVFVLPLDGALTKSTITLDTFDQITSMDLLGKSLYIGGKKGDVEGLWSLSVE